MTTRYWMADSNHYTAFPPAAAATADGLVAIGGDLTVPRLLAAYRSGLFPWFNPGQPILWWSPDPRAVLYLDRLRIHRSLAKTLRNRGLRVSLDRAFDTVIAACAAPRAGAPDGGTWITPTMINAYQALHRHGFAHSVEVWLDERLVGGLYGVALGGAFFGESMFSKARDASKVALVELTRRLREWQFSFIDCQIPSDHLTTLGVEAVPREHFMAGLSDALARPGRPGSWAAS